MCRVGEVNQLYGGNEMLERAQRRESRFFNTCMMATALGAAVSDGLDDGRVVSGVGGQYNFVAMAHALPDARSVLLLRATREAGDGAGSNIRWNYGHCTIPRHLRDTCIDERSEEHTSELQSLMRISYAVFCLKKKNKQKQHQKRHDTL